MPRNMRDLLLEGGHVIDPATGRDEVADVLVRDGRIEAIGRNLGHPDGAERLDCTGAFVAPGFIDVHCHLREPGREDVETIATGARAAAAGGFTAICAMPNTEPVTDNQAAVGFIIRQASRVSAARVYPIGAISVSQKGESLAEFGEMVGAGEYAQTFGIPVIDHCEELTLAHGGSMNEGIVSARLGLKGIPSEAEEIMVIRDILLARRTGGHVHLAHMSTKGSVELIRWGKDRGINVTAEVTPHHLTLTEAAVEGYRTAAKMNPPLRTAEDVAVLQEALRDGTIDLVATDHAPHHYDAKDREFADAPFGIVGLETALALVVTELVDSGMIDFKTLVDRMSTRPARLFGLPGGTLASGSIGDVTVFDPKYAWQVDPATFLSKGRNTPYTGKALRGRARYTVVGGAVVHRAGGIASR